MPIDWPSLDDIYITYSGRWPMYQWLDSKLYIDDT